MASKPCPPGCGCRRHQGWARPCEMGCACSRHRIDRVVPCPEGCTCRKHQGYGRKCLPDCSCGRHGDRVTRHPQYSRWHGILGRCYTASHTSYANYGRRGIKVYQPWRDQPIGFFKYLDEVLGPCPPDHTLDRIDNNGDYAPGNLKWSSRAEQQANKRK